MCKAEGMGICPWGALGAGKFKTEEQRRAQGGRQVTASETDKQISRVLESIANRKATAVTSVALAYVMHKSPYVFPIVGGRKIEHLQGNIEALTVVLTKEDIKEIEEALPFDLGFPHNILWGPEVPSQVQQVQLLGMAGTFDYVAEPQVGSSSTVSCPVLPAVTDGRRSLSSLGNKGSRGPVSILTFGDGRSREGPERYERCHFVRGRDGDAWRRARQLEHSASRC